MDNKQVVYIVYSITPEWYDTGLEIHHEIHRIFSDFKQTEEYFKKMADIQDKGRVWLEPKVIE